MQVMSTWGPGDRMRFRTAMAIHGQTQATCASRLVELGAPSADQGAVSRWMTGRTVAPRSRALLAIQIYIDEAGIAPDDSAPAEQTSDEDGFMEAVRGLTDEPLLGPRQAAFVDAQIARLASGSPMSEADDAARRSLVQILNLASDGT